MSDNAKRRRIERINRTRPFLTCYPDGRRVLTIPPGATAKDARKLLKGL